MYVEIVEMNRTPGPHGERTFAIRSDAGDCTAVMGELSLLLRRRGVRFRKIQVKPLTFYPKTLVGLYEGEITPPLPDGPAL